MNEILFQQIIKHFGSIFNLPVQLKGIIQDINNTYEAYSQTEEKLKNEQCLMNSLMNNIPDHIYFKDSESRFIRVSNSYALSLGLQDHTEVIGKTDFDFFSEEHAQKTFDDEQKIVDTGEPISLEEKQTWTDRADTRVSTTKVPLSDIDGKIIGTIGISKEITPQKRAEISLQNERALFQTIIEMIPDAVNVKDLNGRKTRTKHKKVQFAGK